MPIDLPPKPEPVTRKRGGSPTPQAPISVVLKLGPKPKNKNRNHLCNPTGEQSHTLHGPKPFKPGILNL